MLSLNKIKLKLKLKGVKGYKDSIVRPIQYNNVAWRTLLARRISPYFTWVLLRTSITPKGVSILSIIFGILSAIFFSFGVYTLSLVAIILFFMRTIFDHCDGEVARCRGSFSIQANYMDIMGHQIINPLIIMGITIGVFQSTFNVLYLIFGMFALFGFSLNEITKLKKFQCLINFECYNELKLDRTKQKSKGIINEIKEFFVIDNLLNVIFFLPLLSLSSLIIISWGILFPIKAILNIKQQLK